MRKRIARRLASLITALVLSAYLLAYPEPTKAQCDFTVIPNPLVLVSFGPFLDSGFVIAVASNCIFVADFGVFETPLNGFPTTALGFPFDQWFVFDTGAPVPFTPWVAAGDILFVAANPTDVTVKHGLIILTVLF